MCWPGFTLIQLRFAQQSRFPERCQKILFQIMIVFLCARISGDEHQIDRLQQFMLMFSEYFPETPSHAISFNRRPDFGRSDDSQSGNRTTRQRPPIGEHGTATEALALGPGPCEITTLLDPQRAPEAEFMPWVPIHRRGLNGSQSFAARPAAIAKNCLAAFGGIAVKEPVLPSAADFGRLILSFHKSLRFAGVSKDG